MLAPAAGAGSGSNSSSRLVSKASMPCMALLCEQQEQYNHQIRFQLYPHPLWLDVPTRRVATFNRYRVTRNPGLRIQKLTFSVTRRAVVSACSASSRAAAASASESSLRFLPPGDLGDAGSSVS